MKKHISSGATLVMYIGSAGIGLFLGHLFGLWGVLVLIPFNVAWLALIYHMENHYT